MYLKPGVNALHWLRAFAWGWLLTGSAAAQPAPAAIIFNSANSPLPDNAVSALCYDAPHARLWVGTDYGLARVELTGPGAPVWTIYHAAPGGLPNDAVRTVALADAAGSALWVGTFQGGLTKLDVAAGTWQTWTTATSPLPLDHVRSLAPEPDGGVWIGTAGGLAHRSAGGGWQVLTPFNSALQSGNIAALVRDPVDSTLWIGTVNGGLARWRRGTLRTYTIRADNLPDNTVLSLALDSVRRPVLGTAAAGLVRYRTDSTWAAYGPRTSANPAATVLALAADSAGRWWLGSSEHGVVGLERGRWASFAFGSAAGLPDSTVRAVAVSAGGELWLGLRSGGLARWRPGPLGMSVDAGRAVVTAQLWPNPVAAGGRARVRWEGRGAVAVRVLDGAGRVVWQAAGRAASPVDSSPSTSSEIALPPLVPGLYVVRLLLPGRVLTRRLAVVGE